MNEVILHLFALIKGGWGVYATRLSVVAKF